MILDSYFEFIQKACPPGIWSQGVALARTASITLDSKQDDEIVTRVKDLHRPVSRKVTLWPEDEDWFCDCEAPGEICTHVVASLIALKTKKILSQEAPLTSSSYPQLRYEFSRQAGNLHFQRRILWNAEKSQILTEPLSSLVGGIQSGRIQAPVLSVTRQDFAIDSILPHPRPSLLDRSVTASLFKTLSECSGITLDGQPISVRPRPMRTEVYLEEKGKGFKLSRKAEAVHAEFFQNGAFFSENALQAIEDPGLTADEKKILDQGRVFQSQQELVFLISNLLPSLRKKISVQIQTKNLPEIVYTKPKIVLELDSHDPETLSILPHLTYERTSIEPSRPVILLADPSLEQTLTRKLQSELHLSPGQRILLQKEAAIDFVAQVKNWEISGKGREAFQLYETLLPHFSLHQQDFALQFHAGSSDKPSQRHADPTQVFQAWKSQSHYVPLLEGGFARLPQDWLNRYGDQILSLLAAKNASQQSSLPPSRLPELIQLCEDLNQPLPVDFKKLKSRLIHLKEIPESELPKEIQANLRPYQKLGVDWLNFLRSLGMGALLADDMGLGKTLQALCALQGRTLIVAPTSVLHSWTEQIEKFRPTTSYSLYYGMGRKIEANAQITLTTYAILRLDQKVLSNEKWNTLILDEAQTIKNPESQVARAAHQLQGEFRIALSGTPVENRLEDLWSQFQFINPGLLGDLNEFQSQYPSQTELLKKKVRPFILRRLKKEVAPELPPRTETVLRCELSSAERQVYDSILLSTRQEVLEKLETGGSVFAALELLLRLRQACCHSALIPGQKAQTSSKVNLLIETLENSILSGHRALVFSQWTSFLDLIEPELQNHQIRFSRLDGSTPNRQEVVQEFQSESGPSVLLISLKAGGVGLNLTAADHLFLMDPWWNPTVEDQAASRAHRIGQTQPVLVHRLVTENTIEEQILKLQKSKIELATSILDEETQTPSSLTRGDLLKLLERSTS